MTISDEVIKTFWDKVAKDAEQRVSFFQSDLCKRMIADVAAAISSELNNEDVSYNLDDVRLRFGWSDIEIADIEMFINAMSDASFAVDAFLECPDLENFFDHSWHLKGGLLVFAMHGQGSVYTVMSTDAAPEMYEKLLKATRMKV